MWRLLRAGSMGRRRTMTRIGGPEVRECAAMKESDWAVCALGRGGFSMKSTKRTQGEETWSCSG